MCVKVGLTGTPGLRFVYKMGFIDEKINFMELQQVDEVDTHPVLRNPDLIKYIMQSGTPEMESTRKRLLSSRALLREKALQTARWHPGGFGGRRLPPRSFYDDMPDENGHQVVIYGDDNPYQTLVRKSGRGGVIPQDVLKELEIASSIPNLTTKRTQMARLNQIWWLLGVDDDPHLNPDNLDPKQKEAYDNLIDWMRHGLSMGSGERDNFYRVWWSPQNDGLARLQKALDNGKTRGIFADPDVAKKLMTVNTKFRDAYREAVKRTKLEMEKKQREGRKREGGKEPQALEDGNAAGILANVRRKLEERRKQSENGAAGS